MGRFDHRWFYLGLLSIAGIVLGAEPARSVELPETSNAHPGLASDGTKLYVAWEGTDGGHHLNVLASADGDHWSDGDKATLPVSYLYPAGVNVGYGYSPVNGKPIIIVPWINTRSTNADPLASIYIARSADGKNFTSEKTGEQSSDSPAIASTGSAFYLAWTGIGGGLDINVWRVDNVSSRKVTIPNEKCEGGPSIAVYSSNLYGEYVYVAWVGLDGRPNVMISKDRGQHWGDHIILNEQAMGISVAASNSVPSVYLAWTRPLPDRRIVYMTAPVRTTSFSHRQNTTETSYLGPQIAVYKGRLYLAWTGLDGNKTLNVKRLQ